MGDEEIGVGADGGAGLAPEAFEGEGALGDAAGVFHHHDITRHQIGSGEAGELVVGKIPGLDAEEDAEGTAFDYGLTGLRVELLRCEEALSVLGVVGDDGGADRDFAAGLVDAFSHLERHRAGEFIDASTQKRSGFRGDGGAVGERGVAPLGVARGGGAE